jgi:hypothetical protein
MKTAILIAAILFATFASAGAQIKSVYTSANAGACRTIANDAKHGGSYVGECKGVGGYKVRVLEGDLRQSINIITPTRKKFELNFWQYYSGFSSIGEKLEWRVKGGVPLALIARYNVASGDDSRKNNSYLLISRVGKKEACVVDVIAPGTGQNEKARISADAAASKPCREPGN